MKNLLKISCILALSITHSIFAVSINSQDLDSFAQHPVEPDPNRSSYDSKISQFFLYNDREKSKIDPSSSNFLSLEVLNSIDAQSPAGFLEELKKLQPGLFTRWTAVAPSRSLHGSTMEKPRIIVVDEAGRTFLTWTDAERGRSRIEAMHFDLDGEKPRWTFLERDFRNGISKFEDKTKECALCHSPDPDRPELAQPIWDTYSQWTRVLFASVAPGTPSNNFGGTDYEKLSKTAKEPGSVYSSLHFKEIPDHDEEIRTNLEEAYGLLYPYGENNPWRAQNQPTRDSLVKGLVEVDHDKNGNIPIHFATSQWNMFRLSHEIEAHPNYEKLKYALWIALSTGVPYADFDAEYLEPPTTSYDLILKALGGAESELGKEYVSRFEILREEYEARLRHFILSQLSLNNYQEFHGTFFPPSGGNTADEAFQGLKERFVVDDAKIAAELGALLSFLNITLTDYSTHTVRRAPVFGADSFLGDLNLLLPDRMLEGKGRSQEDVINTWLQQSRIQLIDFEPPSSLQLRQSLNGHELLQQNCQSCHQGNDLAPALPFENQEKFEAWLNPARANRLLSKMTTHDPERRMPYQYPPLHQDEIHELKTYFDRVLNTLETSEISCQTDPFANIATVLNFVSTEAESDSSK